MFFLNKMTRASEFFQGIKSTKSETNNGGKNKKVDMPYTFLRKGDIWYN